MAIIKLIIAFILSLTQVMAPVEILINAGGEEAFFTEWSVNDTFDETDYITIEKNPDEDFVILNLTDIQLHDDDVYSEMGERSNALIAKLIEDHKPDLITLSGDNAWGTMAYIELVDYVDSFGIPWAPVMGNHDGEDCINEFWCAELFTEAENCLFQFGPEDMGYGNYIINITENDSIIHTLFMMDTHDSRDYPVNDGTVLENCYDHLWPKQIKWYKWAVNGIKELEGKTIESTVIMHIPVVEYADAWEAAWDSEAQCFRPEYADTSFGVNREGVNGAPLNNGFFDVCKELGSTKNMVCGHDHVNNFSIPYEGIRLTYALKLGEGCYYDEDLIGGTTLTVNSAGNVDVEHHYLNLADF